MQQTHYIVEERFSTDSEQERKKLVQQKMEQYLRHALQSGEREPAQGAEKE